MGKEPLQSHDRDDGLDSTAVGKKEVWGVRNRRGHEGEGGTVSGPLSWDINNKKLSKFLLRLLDKYIYKQITDRTF